MMGSSLSNRPESYLEWTLAMENPILLFPLLSMDIMEMSNHDGFHIFRLQPGPRSTVKFLTEDLLHQSVTQRQFEQWRLGR